MRRKRLKRPTRNNHTRRVRLSVGYATSRNHREETITYDARTIEHAEGKSALIGGGVIAVLCCVVLFVFLVLPAINPSMSIKRAVDVVEISTTTFPDTQFRAYVKQRFDLDEDGRLSREEREAVTAIGSYDSTTNLVIDSGVSSMGISSLIGISCFPNLESLVAQNNTVATLDISGNTKLEQVDLRGNSSFNLDYGPANINVTLLVSQGYDMEGVSDGINIVQA